MKHYLNFLYKNHHLIYKAVLFLLSVGFVVYLFPKSGKFRYRFEMGKPWQSENLYAPFDFAIRKSKAEIEAEETRIKQETPLYFQIDFSVFTSVLEDFEEATDSLSPMSQDKRRLNEFKSKGVDVLNSLYKHGILDEKLDFPSEKLAILISNQQEVQRANFDEIVYQGQIRQVVEKEIGKELNEAEKVTLLSLFFDIVKPNLSLNQKITDEALAEELGKISYTRGSVDRGTLIISKGEVVKGNKFETLKSLEAEYNTQVWNASSYYILIIAYTFLIALALLMLLLYIRKYSPAVFNDNTQVTFVFFNVVSMVLLTKWMVDFNANYVYIIPIPILPLVLKAFFDARLGLLTHVITILLLGFIVPNNYEYMFLQIIAGIITVLTVSELYKRANLFISVGQITFVYMVAYFAFSVIHEGTTETLKWETFVMFMICGLTTLFVQPLIYAYEKIFGLISDVSLLELSDTNSKLLKELSNKAPGTFFHSLSVANLSEAVANEIGGNAMLIRAGALYHDIGKMRNPTYFIENQSTGINPHNEMLPIESANIIIDHVLYGIEIAKKHNLPDRVIDFIRTHHGTSLVYYFYKKEKDQNPQIDESQFRYQGLKPFSKETAILMMCDSIEAASKSLKEPSSSKIDSFVESIIDKQMEDGQFDNANITFKEILSIKKVLKSKLANMFHLRVEYPYPE